MSKDIIHSRIIIAGAGPAGIIAALMLGKHGIPCLLIDEGRFPRPKICGDGLSGRVISTLSKIDPAITTRLRASSFVTDSWAVRFISPSLKMVEISFKPESENIPPGYICTRSDFDHFLLEEALKYPSVEWMESTHIDQMERMNGSWRIIADQNRKTMQADMLLMATGCNRSLINQICPGYPPMGEEGIGARAYFENVGGTDGKHAI